tara:strand:+ start:253 stop:507 length:255 start_codon:yes stop_codon:yes gene_type:complete
MSSEANNEFLSVQLGDYVAIKKTCKYLPSNLEEQYWFGKVIDRIGGARRPDAWTLFQVMNIDNGEITIINADTVEKILQSSQIK